MNNWSLAWVARVECRIWVSSRTIIVSGAFMTIQFIFLRWWIRLIEWISFRRGTTSHYRFYELWYICARGEKIFKKINDQISRNSKSSLSEPVSITHCADWSVLKIMFFSTKNDQWPMTCLKGSDQWYECFVHVWIALIRSKIIPKGTWWDCRDQHH